VAALKEENQRQRDEIARLKGEQVSPHQGQHPEGPGRELLFGAGAAPRPKRWSKGSKQHTSRSPEEVRGIDRASLPPDARFKGHEGVTGPGSDLPGETCGPQGEIPPREGGSTWPRSRRI